jgi:hypothetical protein
MKKLLIPLLMGAACWVATAGAQERPHEETAGYTAMKGYFGNSMVFYTPAGKVLAFIYFNPDLTYREWRHGKWMQGTFVINNAQDSSMLCLTRMEKDLPITNCHGFSKDKVVGDKWTNTAASFEHHTPDNQAGWLTLEKGHIEPPAQ